MREFELEINCKMQLLNFIQTKINLPIKGIENTIQLINEDCTIPFISRYRKERTGNLDEVQIADIAKFKDQFEDLEKRKGAILKSLEEQGVLTEELRLKVLAANDIISLESFLKAADKTPF